MNFFFVLLSRQATQAKGITLDLLVRLFISICRVCVRRSPCQLYGCQGEPEWKRQAPGPVNSCVTYAADRYKQTRSPPCETRLTGMIHLVQPEGGGIISTDRSLPVPGKVRCVSRGHERDHSPPTATHATPRARRRSESRLKPRDSTSSLIPEVPHCLTRDR